ncbi:F-box and WD repeat domain containing 4, transcript variant X1 [Ictidomys tridecemlineatus]|uniref:F-box/WD repeat-containing protein 4 isoform X1 n=1 Tax=Ictidomys tridecemlineatus TaxID=43179 RepID=UPI00038BED36|nr:F-box/WD repeat-containing protein 4 isoform X1 [Ictidomys tridecemlineatus]KAG3264222.1 F-box and WD repeat domain containing 4, transcript variant X1 [Ictidomys tridecemlineatus]
MVSPPPGAAAVARARLHVGPAPRPLMGSQGRSGTPGNSGPGEGEGGETRELQEARVVRGKRRKGKGKAGAGQGGRGSGAEGKPGLQQAQEAAGSWVEAEAGAGPGRDSEGGGSVEEGAGSIEKGDEGSTGAGKEAQGRLDGKEEERRGRTGRREDARPGKAQGQDGQAWGGIAGTGAAMAAAAEEEAAAREPAARPAAGPALWRLPEELLLLICSYLDMRALGRLAQVCRWLRRFTSCDLLWRRIARASLNSGFTRLGTDLMSNVPVKERVKVSQNWRLGRCREGILLKWRCSQMPWMQLEDDSLYISQANFILAYKFRPDGASLNRRPLGVFAGHDEDVCHFVLANSHIISAGGDGKIGVHKIHSTFTVKYSAHEQEVNCVDCKGGIIVSGSRDRTAKVWPLASGRLGQCLHTIQTEDRVWSIAISPLLSSFVTGTACCGHFSPLRIWDLNSGQLMTHLGSDFPPGAGVLDVMYESPSTLLSCGYDTYVRYWDLRTSVRKCVMEWEEPHDSTLYCLQTDGNHLLATGSSYYGVVRLWDRRQRACLHAFPLTSTPLSSPVYCLRFTTKHLYAALSYNLHVLDFQNP